MTRSNKILLSVVALGAAIAAFYFFVLAPKREEVAKLDTDIAAQEAAVEQARLTLAGYEEAKKTYKRNYATLARLGKAVPTDDDVTSMMVQLEATADRSGVNFEKIELGSGVGGATADRRGDAPADGPARLGSGRRPGRRRRPVRDAVQLQLHGLVLRPDGVLRAARALREREEQAARLDGPPAAPGERHDRSLGGRLPGHAGGDHRRDLHRPAGPGRHRVRGAQRRPRTSARRRGRRPRPRPPRPPPPEPPHERRHQHLAPARAQQALAGRPAAAGGARRRPGPARPRAESRRSRSRPSRSPRRPTTRSPSRSWPKVTAEDRDRRRRVLGVRKDPFAPAPPKKAKAASRPTVERPGGPGRPGHGRRQPTSAPAASPRPRRRTTSPARSSSASARRRAAATSQRFAIPKFGAVPDEELPLLVYMGLTQGRQEGQVPGRRRPSRSTATATASRTRQLRDHRARGRRDRVPRRPQHRGLRGEPEDSRSDRGRGRPVEETEDEESPRSSAPSSSTSSTSSAPATQTFDRGMCHPPRLPSGAAADGCYVGWTACRCASSPPGNPTDPA